MRILLVEDEKKVSSFIQKGLEEEYYSVDAAFDGKDGLKLASSEDYDLIIIDVMLPFLDGYTLTKELRKREIHTPILMLTVKDNVKDKVEGLNSGADDYLTKPFAFEELLARIRALLRRNIKAKSSTLTAREITLDLESHRVLKNDKEIILTPKEFSILEYLMRNKNKVVSRTKLIEHSYDYHFDTETNIIDVYINKVRNKINDDTKNPLIKTIRGIGYIIKDEL
ncbi:MAG: response regulator transcription factor [Ignavibacteriaceae bacterium]